MHMTIHEYGKEKEKVVILIHPSLVMWDYFENVIPLMEGEYHPEKLVKGIKSVSS